MEWVETTAKSVEAAKELALDRLGVDEIDAEFEVLEEPRPGLFGRTRGEARVRARVRPVRPRAKTERRDRKRRGEKTEKTDKQDTAATAEARDASASDKSGKSAKSGKSGKSAKSGKSGKSGTAGKSGTSDNGAGKSDTAGDGPSSSTSAEGSPRHKGHTSKGSGREPSTAATSNKGESAAMSDDNEARQGAHPSVDDVAAEAARFMNGLLAALELDGSTNVEKDGSELEVVVEGQSLGLLIGPRGTTLLAVQDLVRVASQRRLGDHDTRLRVDINGYREKRREALGRFATSQADEVVASGQPRVLEPMPSADRKVIHDALIGRTDVTTRSEGEDPARRVVIAPVVDAASE